MLPPIIGHISTDILALYTSPNGNDPAAAGANGGGGGGGVGNGGNARARGRYAEIGVRRNDALFPEPQQQPQQQQQQQQQLSIVNGQTPASQQQQQAAPAAGSPSSVSPPPMPEPRQHQLHHVQSEGSLSSEGSGGTSAGGTSGSITEEDSSIGGVGVDDSDDVACSITLIERLIRSHPIWFLPGIQRAGAFHLLQGKEEGNFVVRQSSQSDTMALSVRLPAGKGPYIEHYLIQANRGKLSLETSDNRFDNIPSLIAHYSQCCDELPVQLTLPRAMREARNRQQLSSLALLGQEFWRYPMANPKPPESAGSSSNTSSLSSFLGGTNNNNNINNNINNNNINSLSSPKTESIVLNLTPISKDPPVPRRPRPTPPNTLNLTTFNEPLDSRFSISKLSPNDKLSQRLISPNLVQSLVRSPSPIVHNVDSNVLSPFGDIKNNFIRNSQFTSSNLSMTSNFHRNIATGFNELSIRASPDVVQTPASVKSPPPPPPRWAKPGQNNQSNFTVTTTVLFNVNQSGDISTVQSTPTDSNTPSLLSPQSTSSKSLGSNPSSHNSSSTPSSTPVLSSSSKILSNGNRTPQVLSPLSNTGKSSRRRRERDARKNSQHYQESDIMESYYRSSPADKISDYEDIWNTTDQSNHSTWAKDSGSKSSSSEESVRREKILSPMETREKLVRTEQQIMVKTNEKLIIRKDKASVGEKLSYKEITSPEFSSFKPPQDMKSPESTPTPDEISMGKRPDLLSRVCSANSLNSPNMPPRTKFGPMMMARSESNSPMTPDSKHSSPFYAEPADAIPRPTLGGLVARRRTKPLNPVASRFRHSEPGWLQQNQGGCNAGGNALHPIDWDESEETEDKTPLISSSVDNLAKRLGGKDAKKCLPCAAKPVQPPKIKPKVYSDTSWAVDSSWQFIGKDSDDCEPDYDCDISCDADSGDRRFPPGEEQLNRHSIKSKLTAQSIILQRYPELLKMPETTESLCSDRNSSYDNVERRHDSRVFHTMTTTSTMTTNLTSSTPTGEPRHELSRYEPSESGTLLDTDDSDAERVRRSRSFRDYILAPPKLNREIVSFSSSGAGGGTGAGSAIREYALQLAGDRTTTFSQNIENFIQCTKDSKEASPHVVMRNMRQFMSGMKNYLVKHGEREFEKEVEKERVKLKANEFLNLDAILESVMMHLVVSPLREHVYRLFVEYYAANGSIQTLVESIQLSQHKQLHDFGILTKILPPSEASLDRIFKFIEQLQTTDSPLEKLENLLSAIYAIIDSVKHANTGRPVTLSADELLPLIVWVMVRGKFVDAEIEAEYMWGLLHPSLLTGEGGYYLTTLSSAVHVIKTFFKSSQGTMSTINGCSTPDCSFLLRVLVPDELHGSLNTRTLPVRPNMNTRDVCRILAHKTRCTNPQDYGLFKLVQGEETLLGDHECPQELSHCLFAFKRIDAKIAWPKTTPPAIAAITTAGNNITAAS